MSQPKFTLSRIFSPLLFVVCANLAHAQSEQVQVGFTDHSLLRGYADSQIVDRELARDANYRIVLGGLERVRGEVIPEDSQRLRGDVTKITYEVSQEFTGQDVNDFFREQILERGYETLFDCSGRGCGSSNYWANDIFRNRILYGPESNQFYLAFKASAGQESETFFSLYIITRVNRTIYAHLEIVETGGTQELEQVAAVVEPSTVAASNNETMSGGTLQRLRETGSVVLSGIEFAPSDRLSASTDLESLIAVLQTDPALSFYLVAHLREEGQPLDTLMRRSGARANAVRQALIAGGIDAQRIEAAGVGPLAPSCASQECKNRIELVLR